MRRLGGWVLALGLTAGAAAGEGLPLPWGPLAARPGEWVTYRLDGSGGRASWWRMAVVGEERDDKGRDAVWIEMEIGEHPRMVAPLAQLRMLVARTPGLGPEGVSRLQVAVGFDRPREVAPEALAAFTSLPPSSWSASPPSSWIGLPPSSARGRLRIRTGAATPLMTLAGTLTARPIELLAGETPVRRLWLSREVPVLGLARLELPAIGWVMEVAEHGANARSRALPPAPEAPQIHLAR